MIKACQSSPAQDATNVLYKTRRKPLLTQILTAATSDEALQKQLHVVIFLP